MICTSTKKVAFSEDAIGSNSALILLVSSLRTLSTRSSIVCSRSWELDATERVRW